MLDDPRTANAGEAPQPLSTAAYAARLAAEAAFASPTSTAARAGAPVVVRRKRRQLPLAVAPAATPQPAQSQPAVAPRVFRLDGSPAPARSAPAPMTAVPAPDGQASGTPVPSAGVSETIRPRPRRREPDKRPGPVLRQVFQTGPALLHAAAGQAGQSPQTPGSGPGLRDLRERLAAVGQVLEEARRAAAFGLEDEAVQAQWERWSIAADRLLQILQAADSAPVRTKWDSARR
jgi:hypothetical protein